MWIGGLIPAMRGLYRVPSVNGDIEAQGRHVRIRSDDGNSVSGLDAGLHQCVRKVLDALCADITSACVPYIKARRTSTHKTPYV